MQCRSFFLLASFWTATISAEFTHAIESYRAIIEGMYHKVLNDSNTSWLTKLYMRFLPVRVITMPKGCSYAGYNIGRTVALNLERLIEKYNSQEILSVIVHEFMHYKHAHSVKRVLLLPLALAISLSLGAITGYGLSKVVGNILKYHEKFQDSNNKLTYYCITLADITIMVIFCATPMAVMGASFIGITRIISHFCEFQADVSAARFADLLVPMISGRLKQQPLTWSHHGLDAFTYPSGIACVNNLVKVAAQDKLQELLTQEPSESYAILKAQAYQWAQSLVPA